MSETPEWFLGFVKENYDKPPPGAAEPEIPVCRHCGMSVGYLTKHAVFRHGIAVEVLPVAFEHQELAAIY